MIAWAGAELGRMVWPAAPGEVVAKLTTTRRVSPTHPDNQAGIRERRADANGKIDALPPTRLTMRSPSASSPTTPVEAE